MIKVDRDGFIIDDLQNIFQRPISRFSNGVIDGACFCVFGRINNKINNRDIRGRNANSFTVQFSLELWNNKTDSASSACGLSGSWTWRPHVHDYNLCGELYPALVDRPYRRG